MHGAGLAINLVFLTIARAYSACPLESWSPCRLSWQEIIRERILQDLAGSPISNEQKETLVAEALDATEVGLSFGGSELHPLQPVHRFYSLEGFLCDDAQGLVLECR